ncbi:FAD-dependent oxidoreductase [Actinorugispora endophytica]|uniref:ferredoxin--NADP(+) reductase n=1 Tax=Actinorugispora endophytica TaxID=1605990 RepID=A0A4R6UUX1_9ACTN|nr:FAD-dependent oxidoreductase [Actinorugispora endophytica]TDQ49603.1 ferredoxin--NADP+ reductase [Actinorugispora endophytica]
MDAPDPLRVAVIGSGPAGIYTAEALIRQAREPVAVDVLDRLPTPYGLVRYGVAPDHTSIKSVARALARVLEHPDVRFLGGVEYGADVTRADLARAYHAVVYATGASVDRRLGVPGEDLPGSVAATDFVNWYSGHPDLDVARFVLDAEEVAVIGAGNVALDVARILVRGADELRRTDIPAPMLEVLAASRVRRVHLIARRGPAQARFSANELRELGRLENVDAVVRPADIDIDPNSEAMLSAARAARTNLRTLSEWARRPLSDGARRVELRFWLRPAAVLGDGRVECLEVERTRLDGGRLTGTGEREALPVGMVVRSVGYASLPLPDLPFDEVTRTVPHEGGRVLDGEGRAVRGDYVAGWLKRGATGVIGTNKSDAAATVRALLDDAPALRGSRAPETTPDRLLADRGVAPSGYADWLAIDAAEAGLASQLSRGERVKLCGWPELRRAIGKGA